MKHDYKAQQRETFDTFLTLAAQGEALPKESRVEYYLLAESLDNDWDGCEKALHAKGFITERDEDDDTLIVSHKKALTVSAAAIWAVEEIITKTALPFQFMPDGWEFGFDDND